MKEVAMHLAAMVMLAVILVTGFLPGKQEKQENLGINEIVTYKQEEIYIHFRSAKAKRQTDGNYMIEVEFTTYTPGKLSGMRMVTVLCGEQKRVFSLTEDNLEDVHKAHFWDKVQPETVQVEIRAHQTEDGLMLICDGEGQLCGWAETPVDGDRILKLSGAQSGAAYHIYRIADLSDLLSGLVVLSSKPTVKERKAYAVADRYAATLTAGTDGTASCNFTKEGLGDGIYLAVGEMEVCYICVPQVEASGELKSSVVRLYLAEENKMQHNAQKVAE